ncbi:MAG TPA: hypothetical protein VFK74_10490 [Azospira sp.]|nr:hypothetical protein [Azospira sp.]
MYPLLVRHHCRLGAILVCAALLGGCESVITSIFSIGASTEVAHQLGGIVYRTFSEPLPKVEEATRNALARMDILVVGSQVSDAGETIEARTADRRIEIELEAITPATTRSKIIAWRKNMVVVDPATAREIITQTEKSLAAGKSGEER